MVRHCDVLKIAARRLGNCPYNSEKKIRCCGEEESLKKNPAKRQKRTRHQRPTPTFYYYFFFLRVALFLSPLRQLVFFRRVVSSNHGLWSYVKAIDGVWGPPQSPVSQAETVQPTTGDSQHSVPSKMQPPSPARQPITFDGSRGHRGRTQAHPRYDLTVFFFWHFSPPWFQGGCHKGVGARLGSAWVEWSGVEWSG